MESFFRAPFNQGPFLIKESILLKAFSHQPKYFTPNFQNEPAERIYELKSYKGHTENRFTKKVMMFNKGCEINLSKKNLNLPRFSVLVGSCSAMPNLMFLTSFAGAEPHGNAGLIFVPNLNGKRSRPWKNIKIRVQILQNFNLAKQTIPFFSEYYSHSIVAGGFELIS